VRQDAAVVEPRDYRHADRVDPGRLPELTAGDSAVNMTFGPGQWQAAFAASCIDGHAVAVEHWLGEVVR
jgi:hypothetical protein